MTAAGSASPRETRLIIQAFRAGPDAITISRLRDGLLLDVNRGFERISGVLHAAAIGLSLAAVSASRPAPGARRTIRRT